jgi:hypothetical protein
MVDLTRLLSQSFRLRELAGAEDPKWRDAQLAGLLVSPAHGPRDRVIDRLEVLARTVLQPIRDHVDRPVRINSGFRSPAKNAATPGSSASSQHMYGEAADIAIPGYSDAQLRDLADWIGTSGALPFGQVIFEDARPGTEGGAWIHVSLGTPYRAASRCGERWTWTPATGYRRVR